MQSLCCIQPLRNVAEWFKELSMKDSGVLYEDPYVQVCLSRNSTFLMESTFFVCMSRCLLQFIAGNAH